MQRSGGIPKRRLTRSTATRASAFRSSASSPKAPKPKRAEAPELDARHLGHVAGEQSRDPVGLSLDGVEELRDARKKPAAPGPERPAHFIEDGIPEASLVAILEAPPVLAQDVGEDQRLGPASEGDVAEVVLDLEAGAHRLSKGLARGALGEEQGAIHIEEPGQAHAAC